MRHYAARRPMPFILPMLLLLAGTVTAHAQTTGPIVTAPFTPYLSPPASAIAFSARGEDKARQPLTDIAGIDFNASGGVFPPDIVGDVGPDHYVQMTNASDSSQVFVFDKASGALAGQFRMNDLWTGTGSPVEGLGQGDPIVLYDHLADRWVLTEFSFTRGAEGVSEPFFLTAAVSQTADPMGEYFLYEFQVEGSFPDYPKYALWPHAYFVTTNEAEEDFLAGAFALDRLAMLAGDPAESVRFQIRGNFMLPADLDGPEPPEGSPGIFYTIMDDVFWPQVGFPGDDRLEIREFVVDFANPGQASFVLTEEVALQPFDYDPGGDSFDVVPQAGTLQRVDAIGEWPMWRLQYRNFGSHETLVGNFTVDVDGNERSGIRWFELRREESGLWNIHQEGTLGSGSEHRWMGSIAMDAEGNIALGYSVSSRRMFPAMRYVSRLAGDPLGAMSIEREIGASEAPQRATNRWGDYSAMNVDPTDDTLFWYTNELIDAEGLWLTRIVTFRAEEAQAIQEGEGEDTEGEAAEGEVEPEGEDPALPEGEPAEGEPAEGEDAEGEDRKANRVFGCGAGQDVPRGGNGLVLLCMALALAAARRRPVRR